MLSTFSWILFARQLGLTFRETALQSNTNYPKVEYRGLAFLKDTSIIPNLIFAIQQVTIMQVLLNAKHYRTVHLAGYRSHL
jgi:hypothetical protein